LRNLLFALLLIPTTVAAQQSKPAADLRDDCGAFEVRLHSKSGDPMNDDMSVVLVFPGADPVNVALPPALYTPREPLLNVKNVCRQLTGLELTPGHVLLLLSENNRPTWDLMDAVLVDVTNKKVADVVRNIGEIKSDSSFVVRRSTDGQAYDVRLIRELLAASGCDCADAAIEDWMRITAKGTNLFTRWVPHRPFTGQARRRSAR